MFLVKENRLVIAVEQLKDDEVWIYSRRWEPTELSDTWMGTGSDLK